jgi:rare lipoprotein A
MSRRLVQHLVIIGLMAGLAACAGHRPTPSAANRGEGTYKVGAPYEIDGVWYYPHEDWSYDQTGIASWYGEDFHGKFTANGEIFDLNALTAAHKTLPMPCVVQVTNLENGRSIQLRVNDRGPYVAGRIIDVSRRAAQLLGFEAQGTAKVEVKILVPQSIEVASLAQHNGGASPPNPAYAAPVAPVLAQSLQPASDTRVAAAEPPAPAPQPAPVAAAPPPVPAPTPAPAPRPAAAAMPAALVTVVPVKPSQIYIQAGAFAVPGNAQKVKSRLDRLGTVNVTGATVNGVQIYRVRLGPIGSVDEADKLLDRVLASGISEARIIVD